MPAQSTLLPAQPPTPYFSCSAPALLSCSPTAIPTLFSFCFTNKLCDSLWLDCATFLDRIFNSICIVYLSITQLAPCDYNRNCSLEVCWANCCLSSLSSNPFRGKASETGADTAATQEEPRENPGKARENAGHLPLTLFAVKLFLELC